MRSPPLRLRRHSGAQAPASSQSRSGLHRRADRAQPPNALLRQPRADGDAGQMQQAGGEQEARGIAIRRSSASRQSGTMRNAVEQREHANQPHLRRAARRTRPASSRPSTSTETRCRVRRRAASGRSVPAPHWPSVRERQRHELAAASGPGRPQADGEHRQQVIEAAERVGGAGEENRKPRRGRDGRGRPGSRPRAGTA